MNAEDYIELIKDPIIELLAIKLYEHDCNGGGTRPTVPNLGWWNMCCDDRESYRNVARGTDNLGYTPNV